jgi:PAS domain S-box-containing protein
MTGKPTHEELDRRIIKELEKEAGKRKEAEEELRKYQFLIESAHDAIFFKDLESRYIIANDNTLGAFGLSREDVIGKNDYELMPDQKEAKKNVHDDQIVFKLAKAKEVLKHMTGADGKKYWFEAIKIPQFDNDGTVIGLAGIARDITKREQAEKTLRDNESKLSAMLASVGDHMSMMDKDLNILWANEIAEKIFGNDIIGKKCYEVYHKRTEPCEPYPCITLRAFENGTIYEHDTQVIDKDGKRIFFHCTANVALRNDEGNPTAVLEISRDITEKVQAVKALHKAKDELESRVEERTRELKIEKINLEEANIALQVLLEKRQEDKKEMEDNVLTNAKEMIGPYFEKIRKTKLDDQQKALLSIMGYNINEIISPFTRKMSQKYLNLTPTEIEVTNLIRYGSDSKEIAELMNLSTRTIYNHRKNIRKKFGLKNKKTNLRSHLLSIY